jgi:hypothetical protein
MGRFFAKAFGIKAKEEEQHEDVQYAPLGVKDDSSIHIESQIHSRVPSGALSYQSDISSNPDQQMLRKAKSVGPGGRGEYKSLLALTEGDPNALFQRPPPMRPLNWTAGPTKSFKQGVVLEWRDLMNQPDELEWRNDEGELGQDYAQDPRTLGRRLLYSQLSAATPYYAVYDDTESGEAIEMLLERWIEQGTTRTRVAEWEKVMNIGQRRHEESVSLMPIEETMRFDFRRT